ncbi:hypothetical protein [Jonesia quinghaiensis]|uniref:hypothetical protein n=1 Tax=Jonesia quinghaiensis TaxID=262806 RepID=UPI000424043B|nr:hypothetical protein [Jonesia quinghaiensis]
MATIKSVTRALGALTGAIALAMTAPLAAQAATGISVSPSTVSGASGAVTVTVNNPTVGDSYTVGLCSTARFGGVPACTYVADDVTATSSSTFTIPADVTKTWLNEHRFIPGGLQPTTYDCGTNLCEIIVVQNHDGSSSVTNFTAPITFN